MKNGRITNHDVKKMIELREDGYSIAQIAAEIGCGTDRVHKYLPAEYKGIEYRKEARLKQKYDEKWID